MAYYLLVRYNANGGTTNYMPPEAISQNIYSYGNDIWAVGIIMYYLIIGKLPFNQKDDNETKEKAKKSNSKWFCLNSGFSEIGSDYDLQCYYDDYRSSNKY